MLRAFFLGFIRLHILYHASKDTVFGLDLIRELSRHGYQLSPGTIYPILHGLERDGYLEFVKKVVNGKVRKYYQATDIGKQALLNAYPKVCELVDEMGEELCKD